jgi:hypothetical protein
MAGPREFLRVFRTQWLAAMSGAFSVPFATLAVFADSRFAQLIWVGLAVGSSWFAAYKVWGSEHKQILELEERLRPKIKVLGMIEHRDSFNGVRTFEMEIKNDSEDELTNCLAKVTAINLFKMNPDGAQDYSAPYIRHLPLALRTAKNVDRDGGGPFHLRARETKKIPIFSRQDGMGKDLQLNFEKGAPEFLKHITMISTCDLEITIYGAPNPPKEKIHLAVETGVLRATRVV